MNDYRLRFKKTGRSVYISHLDLMRTMQRAFSRSGYKLKYSEGFNPHPQISILQPLSVGTGSLCELMDFRLEENCTQDDMPSRLSEALPEGIDVIEVYAPSAKASELKYISVLGSLEYDRGAPEDAVSKLTAFFENNQVIVKKKTKRGIADFNVSDAMKSISFTKNSEHIVSVEAVVSVFEPVMNPELISTAIGMYLPELAPDFSSFCRIETFKQNMELFR